MSPQDGWREFAGERVKVYAPGGSYAERCAPAELREAERIVAALENLLAPSTELRQTPTVVYLTDPVPDGALESQDPGDKIVRVLRPEGAAEPLARSLARALVGRWFGLGALSLPRLVDGIAGLAAAGAEAGPSAAEADELVRARIAEGRPVSIFSSHEEESESGGAATSFVAYLLETFGAPALRELLAAYDPARSDQAAVTAYQRPLGSLEESWLASLRRGAGRADAFRALFEHLGPLLRPFWRRELEAFALMVLGLSYVLSLPLATRYLLDTVIPARHARTLVAFALLLLVIYLLNAAVGMRRAYVTNLVNETILLRLEEQMFASLQRLSHDFYSRAKVGDLTSRLSNDLAVISAAMAQVLGVGIVQSLTVLAAAVTVLVLSPLLGVLVLATIPLFAATYLLLRSRFQTASYEVQRLTGEAAAAAQENLSAQPVVKALGLEARSIASYRARLNATLRAFLRLVMVAALFETSIGLAVSLGQLVVLGAGGYLVIRGSLTVGTLVAFIGLLPSLLSPIAALSGVGQAVQNAAGALARVDELLDEPASIADRPGAVELPPLAHEIRFQAVAFGYGGTQPILRDVDLVLPAGQHTAIVGPSGSGKTSILNLLLRFWDPGAGSVLFDGRDIRDATLASLRGQIGLVFQDTFLFDTTVRENIAFGTSSATDADVVEAARAAKLDHYIESLQAGYDTMLGERGVRMSGGQRQRLAIARALIRDPAILVFDEATSALDAQTEREILATLALVARNRTTVTITHRLSVAATADRIIVLDRGRVVGEGTHAELIRDDGLYRRLYEQQTAPAPRAVEGSAVATAELLRTVPLFAGLASVPLALLGERFVATNHEAGVDIVREGERGDRFFIVTEGKLEVLVRDSDSGEEQRVNALERGDYFGELALLTEERRSATVRTTAPTELYALDRADFAALLETEPGVRNDIMATLSRRRVSLHDHSHS